MSHEDNKTLECNEMIMDRKQRVFDKTVDFCHTKLKLKMVLTRGFGPYNSTY